MTGSVFQNLRQQFDGLSAKDRFAVTLLAIFIALVLIVYVLLLPASRYADNAAQYQRDRAELLTWMQANEAAARMLPSHNRNTPKPATGQSILSLSAQTAQTHNISFQRFEPFAEDGLRIWLDNIDFNNLLAWLNQLQQQYGIDVLQASIDRGATSGKVNARLELLLTQ